MFAVWSSLLAAAGCASHPPTSEKGILSDVTQLTSGFDRAGEAYFSPRMDWIVFQATPKGESNYQMYVAPLRWNSHGGRREHVYLTPVPMTQPVFPKRTTIAGIGTPTRVSPEPSKNTCGFFSPDQMSLIFASTANKEPATKPAAGAATQPTAGYQRSTNTYKWEFPAEMEIFRADGWEAAVEAAAASGGVNLALHPLTDNHAYDAECAYSPDGKWIVFTSNRTGGRFCRRLLVGGGGEDQRHLVRREKPAGVLRRHGRDAHRRADR
jgi:Tol biopolymer transport system component